jgi:hypothetical protein
MHSIHEEALGNKVEKDADRYEKKFRTQMRVLENSPLAKVRPITPYDHYALGKQLESFEIYKSLCEDDGTLAQLGKIPNVAFTMLSASC